MGAYVYSLRKKHVEALHDYLFPIDVVAYEYAYKESYVREGEYGYASMQRLSGRTSSMAEKAKQHYMDRAKEEFGTTQIPFYFAMGGLTDGSYVYMLFQTLPTTGYDEPRPDGPATKIGRLYKVGRGKWVVSNACPEHTWHEYTVANDGTHIQQCERCDAIKDPRFTGIKQEVYT